MKPFIVEDLLNAKFDFGSLDLATPVTAVFGWGLCPKLLEILIPNEDELIAANYPDSAISLEKLFALRPDKLLRWKSEDYPDGLSNTEIDFIGFVLQQTVIICGHKPKVNRFLNKPFRQQYCR